MLQQKFPQAAKSFFTIDSFIKNSKQDFVLVTSNEEEALQLYKQALFFYRAKIYIIFRAMIQFLMTIRHQIAIFYLSEPKH